MNAAITAIQNAVSRLSPTRARAIQKVVSRLHLSPTRARAFQTRAANRYQEIHNKTAPKSIGGFDATKTQRKKRTGTSSRTKSNSRRSSSKSNSIRSSSKSNSRRSPSKKNQ